MLVISFHLNNQYYRSPTVTRIIIDSSETLSHKGIPMKPIIALIPNVDFNLVQSITANRFLIKQKRYNGTHTHYTDIFTLETQIGKTCNLFRVAPLILYSPSFFIVYNTIYIGSCGIQTPNPLTRISQEP